MIALCIAFWRESEEGFLGSAYPSMARALERGVFSRLVEYKEGFVLFVVLGWDCQSGELVFLNSFSFIPGVSVNPQFIEIYLHKAAKRTLHSTISVQKLGNESLLLHLVLSGTPLANSINETDTFFCPNKFERYELTF